MVQQVGWDYTAEAEEEHSKYATCRVRDPTEPCMLYALRNPNPAQRSAGFRNTDANSYSIKSKLTHYRPC